MGVDRRLDWTNSSDELVQLTFGVGPRIPGSQLDAGSPALPTATRARAPARPTRPDPTDPPGQHVSHMEPGQQHGTRT